MNIQKLNYSDNFNQPNRINDWILLKKIGEGSFGEIFIAKNNEDNKTVAIKVESANIPNSRLNHEYKIYKILRSKGIKSIPKVYEYSTHENKNIMVMDIMGENLETLFKKCERNFSLRTICLVGLNILGILEKIHENKILHRDIKPQNIVKGLNEQLETEGAQASESSNGSDKEKKEKGSGKKASLADVDEKSK